jgi:hypothetical protein
MEWPSWGHESWMKFCLKTLPFIFKRAFAVINNPLLSLTNQLFLWIVDIVDKPASHIHLLLSKVISGSLINQNRF